LLKDNVEKFTTLYGDTVDSVSIALNNLALLYIDMRQYEAAIPVAKRALVVTEKSVGKQHRRYPVRIAALAAIYKNQGNYEQAAILLESALPDVITNQGKEHPAFTSVANNLVNVYRELGRYAEAQQLLDEVLENAEKVYGKDHRTYSIYLSSLSDLKQVTGDFAGALAAIEASSAIDLANYGKFHIKYFTGENRRPVLLEQLGRTTEMATAYRELTEVMGQYMREQFPYFNEKQQEKFLVIFRDFHAKTQSALLRHPTLTDLAAVVYDQNLILKGALRNNYRNLMKTIREDPNPLVQQLGAAWEDLKTTLSQQYNLRISRRMAGLDSLERRADELENQLATKSSEQFKKNRALVNVQTLQATLLGSTVAIEFSHFAYQDLASTSDSIIYAAYVLTADQPAPQMIPLFEAQEIGRLRAAKTLYSTQSTARQAALHDLIWKPLSTVLNNKKTIFFAPSGVLHRINFGAIAIDETTTIADRFQLQQLGSTRLLLSQEKQNPTIQSAVVYGGIQYDADSLNLVVDNNAVANVSAVDLPSFRSYRGDNWEQLPFTEREAQAVQQMLQQQNIQIQLRTKQSATEAHFKKLSSDNNSPELIHLATHGYFFPSAKTDARVGVQATKNPLVRSGLILAGANRVWEGGEVLEGQEDGILTAYEIAQMDLSATKLVVLSACETGLGDIEGSEGVYGLQRAFKIAGVDYILMSLWKVKDEQTQEFMTAFYEAWLTDKQDIPTAFAQAQQTMQRKYALPFNPKMWAGFVLTR
ncbi:MAG: CHAT domain-containing protein, partial [Saprospiraceae bacterium]